MEKPISATTTTKRRTSSETSTNNSKPINSQIDQQQILDFIQNYRKKRDEIQAAEDKFNYITRTEAKNEFLRTKNIEKNISINDLNSKCKKLKHQVQLLNSKLQQKSFEQKYMLSSVANIKEKQRHIKNHTGWYAGYGKGVVPLPPGGTSGGTTRAFKNMIFWSNQPIFRLFFKF